MNVDIATSIVNANRARLLSGKGRTDTHRRGAFVPEAYSFFGAYYLAVRTKGERKALEYLDARIQAWLASEDVVDCEGLVYGDWGRCGVCGAHFSEGEIWRHKETLDLVHMGRDCCEKYDMVSGTDWDALSDERRRAGEARKTAARNSGERARILAAYPELADALKTDHYIVRDIARRFERDPFISEKQIALVFKLAAEVAEKARVDALRAASEPSKIAAPVSDKRVTVQGVVVSVKSYDSDFGPCLKMTVKVSTPEGEWLCWGSVPSTVEGAESYLGRIQRGDVVSFDCKLVAGREPHFALFKRPTKCRQVSDTVEVA